MSEEKRIKVEYVVEPMRCRNGKLEHHLYVLTEHGKGKHCSYNESKHLKKLSAGCVYEIDTTEDGQSIFSGTATFVRRFYPEEEMAEKRRANALALQDQQYYKAATSSTTKLGKTLDGLEKHVEALNEAYWNTSANQRVLLLAAIMKAVANP